MIKQKKGSEMIFSPIMAAVIVLLVIAVSAYIFLKQSGKLNVSLNSCEQNGGECTIPSECDTGQLSYDCPKKGGTANKVCCAKKRGFV